jgi:hypothetical protein
MAKLEDIDVRVSVDEKLPGWAAGLLLASAVAVVVTAATTCAAKDSERRAWQVRDSENESREGALRETQLRHETARECCRQPGVGYATCIEAFSLVPK